MRKLETLTNNQLGEFIELSLVHGTNTQFSYEILYEVAQRLCAKSDYVESIPDESFQQIVDNTYPQTDVPELTIAQQVADEQINKAYDALKAQEEPTWVFNPAPVQDEKPQPVEVEQEPEVIRPKDRVPNVKAQVQKQDKEKPVEKSPFAVQEQPEPTLADTIEKFDREDLKRRTMKLRQADKVSADAIKEKLAQLDGVKTLSALGAQHLSAFNDFLAEIEGQDND